MWQSIRFWVLPSILILAGLILLSGCGDEKDIKQIPEYKGPVSEVQDLEMIFSDSARLKIHLKAPLQTEKANGDRYFPKGVYVEFFDDKGAKTSTLKANKGIRYANNVYNVTGNVVVNNLEKGETLNTEELNWKPDTKVIYTEKFVTITTDDEILKGEGLDAAQDFTRYSIRKPTGVFPLKQTATDEAN
jgi:LPS export ABC transporter protein LptC